MVHLINIKKIIILLLFSISIFFSYVEFFYIELRFLYLFLIIFIFFEKESKNLIKISIICFIFFFIHLLINNILNFEYYSVSNLFQIIPITQIFIISITVFLIYHFRVILLTDLKKIFDFFICIFMFFIFIFNLTNKEILLDTLYKCDLGFFYYTKFIFNESSHFGIIANAVIINFIYHIRYYIKKKILFFLNLVFIFFTFGNFSLTFYLASLFSLILIFISYKHLDKYRTISLILFLLLSNSFMFFGSSIYKFLNSIESKHCVSKMEHIVKKHKLKSNSEIFKGSILEPKKKFRDIFKKNHINLSAAVQIYSFYVTKEALTRNLFGYGIHNYKKFRSKIDHDQKKKQNKVKDLRGDFRNPVTIIFYENYMPTLPLAVLNYNQNSGSNNFSKILVEFGIFGVLLIFLFFRIFLSKKIDIEFKFLLFPLIYGQLFIRGTGYFNSGFLIISIILIILMFDKIFKKDEK